jgi:hypothetical protein
VWASTPSASTSRATWPIASPQMSARIRLAPSRASSSVVVRPIPLPAPVTSAHFPAISFCFISSPYLSSGKKHKRSTALLYRFGKSRRKIIHDASGIQRYTRAATSTMNYSNAWSIKASSLGVPGCERSEQT